ncbi:MAG: EAL domain-containing protein [Phycisphaerae bacterium]|nr:EAL domain-containing protein [Gemmatimonadaceae bacterium]
MAVIIAAASALALSLGIDSGAASQQLREGIANFAGLLAAAIPPWLAWKASRNERLERRVRSAWRWLTLACICVWAGDVAWFVLESVLHRDPTASIADVAYLSYYPLLMVGLLTFPHSVRSRSDRAKMWLDATIVICACSLAVWRFAVSPDLHANREQLWTFALTVGQPIGDVVTLLGVTVLWMRRSGGTRDRVMTALAISVLCNVIGDVCYANQVRGGTYESGGYIELAWIGNRLFLALAAYWQLRETSGHATDAGGAKRPLPTLLLPYAAIALAYFLLLQAAFQSGTLSFRVLVTGASVITLLVIVRQMAAVRENMRLHAATETLRSEQRFHALVQNTADVIAIVDADTTVRYVSPSLQRLTGLNPEQALGTKMLDAVHRDDRSAALLFFVTLARDGAVDVYGEWRMRNASKEWRHTENVGSNMTNDATVGGLVVATRDVTVRRALEDQLRYQAFHDALTGVANRQLFQDRVDHAFKRSVRDRNSVAALYVDLDNFKFINDSHGHAVGDEVLRIAVLRLGNCIREGDTLARLGGDEFAILLEDLVSVDDACLAAERMIAGLSQPTPGLPANLSIRASIGVSIGTDSNSAEELLRNADIAMYVAKSEGKGKHVRYVADMHAKVLDRLEVEADLRRAIEDNQFVLSYQPIVALGTGELTSVEALIRWNHPTRGLLQPAAFIDVAEETGLVVPIGRWALREATRQVRAWQVATGQGMRVGVNISTRHLCDPSLLDDVCEALNDSGLAPEYLLIEITETILIKNTAEIIVALQQIKAMGVAIALDDFGTGYSSLSYLQQLPINVLKIDKSFIDKLVGAQTDAVLVKAIVDLGATLQLTVVAEGIVTLEQVIQLQALGCQLGQGYYFDRAVPPEKILAYLRGNLSMNTVHLGAWPDARAVRLMSTAA